MNKYRSFFLILVLVLNFQVSFIGQAQTISLNSNELRATIMQLVSNHTYYQKPNSFCSSKLVESAQSSVLSERISQLSKRISKILLENLQLQGKEIKVPFNDVQDLVFQTINFLLQGNIQAANTKFRILMVKLECISPESDFLEQDFELQLRTLIFAAHDSNTSLLQGRNPQRYTSYRDIQKQLLKLPELTKEESRNSSNPWTKIGRSSAVLIEDDTSDTTSIFWMRPSFFQKWDNTDNTANEVLTSIELATNNHAGVLVLDIRGNIGGMIQQVQAIANMFLPKSLLLYSVLAHTSLVPVYSTFEGKPLWTKDLVILIDRFTASSAELLAGILQYHNRAVVFGEPSYGKASTQDMFKVSDNIFIKVTTGEFFLPSGNSSHGVGVIPNIHTPEFISPKYSTQLQRLSDRLELVNHRMPHFKAVTTEPRYRKKADREVESLKNRIQQLILDIPELRE